MLNRILMEINLSIKLLIVLLLVIILLIAKSMYLIIFISILVLILILLSNKSVKFHLNIVQKSIWWLLFIFFVYIIIYGFDINIVVFEYKLLLIILLINILFLTINFDNLHSAIYTLLLPLKNTKANIYNISFNMTISIYNIFVLINSKSEIIKSQLMYGKRKYGFKYILLPRLFRTMKDTEDFKNNLKLRFYVLKQEKINIKSIIIFVLFVVLFIVSIFKEVIL